MFESNNTSDNVPSTAALSTSLLLRSKSYDTKLDMHSDDAPVFIGYDSIFSPSYRNKINDSNQDNDQTKIIVTSFAPTPNDYKLRHNQASYAQVRPMSHQITNGSYNNHLNNNNNNNSNSNNNSNQSSNKPDNQEQNFSRTLSVLWPNGKTGIPVIVFCAKVLRKTYWECKKVGEQYRLTFKFVHGERKLIKAILEGHGFREVHPNSSEFNMIWSGSNLKSYTFRSLQENQKVNHFPRSCELTRKDRLYKNIQRMQKEKGQKAFNIVPTTFVLPFEIDEFYTNFYKEKGIWIVKPVCLSRGRGIYLISHPDQIPLDDNLVVSKYLSNPLLIEGFKFDLRLYVAVTSFDPLVFYLYEEGLTRFATIKYDQNIRNIRNTCMHLTNYSVNKKNEKYVKCNDPDVENYGNKWSMSALIRYLNSQGKDTFSLMMNIEEAIIKTLLSVESPMASAARMFMPHRGNCFELFGFDILIDEYYKPWVLEVNLSPSLDCDALLDVRIKSTMISDLFTLTGVYCQNPSIYSNRSRQKDVYKNKNEFKLRVRPHSASMGTNNNNNNNNSNSNQKTPVNPTKPNDPLYDGLNQTEQSILKAVVDENLRSNGWVRLFPTSDTWEFYSQFLEVRSTTYNMMLHKKIYPRRWQSGTPKKATLSRAKVLQNSYELYKANNYNSSETSGPSLYEALDRYKKYERKLKDTVKPTEETLKKLSTLPYYQAQQNQNLKSNFSMFPNGDKNLQKDISLSSEMLANEEDSMNSSIIETPNRAKSGKLTSMSSSNRKHLPSLNNKGRCASAFNYRSNYKYDENSNKKSLKPKNKNEEIDDLNEDNSGEDNDSDSTEKHKLSNKDLTSANSDVKYDLSTILKYLDQGFYLSRIQVRNAFALYLFKIQVRLVSESQSKDESNLQQMDLVLRFIKKAAPNLSQEFKVYVPSRRLPLCEQKRMLAKQLHDFLHIYRKDTEQIRIEIGTLLEVERRKNRHKLIEDKGFQSLLYKCSEADLEEIMSAYMKNSQDSSVFLGTSKNSSNKDSNGNSLTNENTESINFNLNQFNKNENSNLNFSNVNTNTPMQNTVPALNLSPNTNNNQYSKNDYNHSNDSINQEKIKSEKKPKKKYVSNLTNMTKNKDELMLGSKSGKTKKMSPGEEELCDSQFSCDSRSIFSKSSDSESESRSRSNSSTSSRTYKKTLKSHHHLKDKRNIRSKNNNFNSKYKNSNVKLSHLNSNSFNKEKTRVPSRTKLNQDYHSIMTNIYLNTNKSSKTKSKPTSNLARPSTSISNNGSNKLAPLTVNSQLSMGSNNQNGFISPLSINSNKESLPSPLNNVKPKYDSNVFIQKHQAQNSNRVNSTKLLPHEDDQTTLSNGLKNLQIKQQERIYSAAKSVRITSSLTIEDSNAFKNNLYLHKANTNLNLKPKSQTTDDDSNTDLKRLKELTSMNNGNSSIHKLNSNSNNNIGSTNDELQSNDTVNNKNLLLIEKLEKQKEKTNKLLAKSKAKHDEMMSTMSSSSSSNNTKSISKSLINPFVSNMNYQSNQT